jgi:hypothetical protein
MPTLDFIDIGEVVNTKFDGGTITAINTASDTCTVTVGGHAKNALIFYH